MKPFQQIATLILMLCLAGCNSKDGIFDASGTFEAEEVIVSSELSGKITRFDIEEGRVYRQDSVVGTIDAKNIALQKEQVEANIRALSEKTINVAPKLRLLADRLAVQQSQLDNLILEKTRIENLLERDAATRKQLDDINSRIKVSRKEMSVTRQQIDVERDAVATQNRSILSEGEPLQKRVEQLDEELKKAKIINPVAGTVITKYAEEGEITSAGKALYKIADLSIMTLRAYITGTQFSQVKLGQPVRVLVDDGPDNYKEFPGTITWISDKAEFTPKTIQTREERANLVYAMKVKLKNDGFLKIGMYGEVLFDAVVRK